MTSTLMALVALILILIAVRSYYERRWLYQWQEAEAERELAWWRSIRTVMYPAADSLDQRHTTHYINRLTAEVAAGPQTTPAGPSLTGTRCLQPAGVPTESEAA